MTKTIDALKLAVEALEGWKEYDTWTDQQMWNDDDEEALAAIREALAEPVQEHESREDIAAKEMFEGFSKAWAEPVKQEPIGYIDDMAPGLIHWTTGDWPNEGTKLYAAPVSVESAVLAEREACAKVCDMMEWRGRSDEAIWKGDAADECAAAIRARGNK